jgi:hypothetical protein
MKTEAIGNLIVWKEMINIMIYTEVLVKFEKSHGHFIGNSREGQPVNTEIAKTINRIEIIII